MQFSNYRKSKVKKKKILKEARGKKHLTYRGTKIRITSDFSETMSAKREWSEIFNMLREETHQILDPVKLSFKSEGGIKISSDKQKLREFVASRPAIQGI